jgi:hypothetical protein
MNLLSSHHTITLSILPTPDLTLTCPRALPTLKLKPILTLYSYHDRLHPTLKPTVTATATLLKPAPSMHGTKPSKPSINFYLPHLCLRPSLLLALLLPLEDPCLEVIDVGSCHFSKHPKTTKTKGEEASILRLRQGCKK